MRLLTIALFLSAALCGLYIHLAATPTPSNPLEAQKMMTIEEYVRKHIGTLSPESPVLGGTFYITDMQINHDAQTGTVWYEDGHIAFVADFAYTRAANGTYSLPSFMIRND